MEEEVLSDENSIKDGSYNILGKSSKEIDNQNESYKETITVTDTDMDRSVPITAKKKSIPMINLNTEFTQGGYNGPLTDKS
jgi:hypothetical protein